MNCRWKQTSEQDGVSVYRCTRYGCRFRHRKVVCSRNSESNVHCECNGVPSLSEFGNWIALILEAFFIAKHSWLRLKTLFGFKPVCGCQKREEALNTIGSRIQQFFEKAT